MFTLKFYKHINDDETFYDVVCAPHYDVYTRPNGIKTVTTYLNTVKENGVERHIRSGEGSLSRDYDVCYVENVSGKTIDTIRPGNTFVNKEL